MTRFSASARWISSIWRFERSSVTSLPRSTPEISAPMIGRQLLDRDRLVGLFLARGVAIARALICWRVSSWRSSGDYRRSVARMACQRNRGRDLSTSNGGASSDGANNGGASTADSSDGARSTDGANTAGSSGVANSGAHSGRSRRPRSHRRSPLRQPRFPPAWSRERAEASACLSSAFASADVEASSFGAASSTPTSPRPAERVSSGERRLILALENAPQEAFGEFHGRSLPVVLFHS